jgi:hypothetical protein
MGLSTKTSEDIPDRSNLNGLWDEPAGAAPRADVHFELESVGFAGFAVSIPSLLRKIELSLLQHPERLGRHYLSLANVRSVSDVEVNYDNGSVANDTRFEE